MTENEFFNILMDKLNNFPEAELYDIVIYYQNYFSHNLSLGKSQEEIITELGDPNSIAEKFICEHKKLNYDEKNTDILKESSQKYKTSSCSITVNSNLDNSSKNNPSIENPHKKISTNTILNAGIIILSAVILLPILFALLFIILNNFNICIEVIVEASNSPFLKSLNLCHSVVPGFALDLPRSVLFLFSLGAVLMSVFFTFVILYFVKLVFILLIKLSNKSKENVGDL